MIRTPEKHPEPEWLKAPHESPRAPFLVIHGLPNWLLFLEIAFITVHGWGLFRL